MTRPDLYTEIRGVIHAEIAELCERLVAEHGAAEAMKHLRASLEPVPSLGPFARDVLRECKGGDREPRPWGAAVGAALERLRGLGLISGGQITSRGYAALERVGVVLIEPSERCTMGVGCDEYGRCYAEVHRCDGARRTSGRHDRRWISVPHG